MVLEPAEPEHSHLFLCLRGAASLPQSLYPQDENGVNKPVCSYVRVLQAGRLLESPRHAARFVSLLAYQKAPVVGGGSKQEQWCTLLAFLCRQKVEPSPAGWRGICLSEELLRSGPGASICNTGTTAQLLRLPSS